MSLAALPGITALRRTRPVALLVGLMSLTAFAAASLPSTSNTIMESAGLSILAILNILFAFSACGYLGRNMQITGIAAEVLIVGIAWALANNGMPAVSVYLTVCLVLVHTGAALVRFSIPALDRRVRAAGAGI